MKSGLMLTAAAALALAACSNSADDADTATADNAAADMNATPETADAAAATPAAGPQGFVDAVAASDMFEIESGKLAQASGKSQEVKDFAAMLVTDHTKSTAELKAAAGQSEGVTVTPKLTAKQQSDLDALKGAGANFDRVFKEQQVSAHATALALLEAQAANGEGPLKAFAAKTAPVVERHLEKARTLP